MFDSIKSLLSTAEEKDPVDSASLRPDGTGFVFGASKKLLRDLGLLVADADGGDEELVADDITADVRVLYTEHEVDIVYRLPRVDALRDRHDEIPDELSPRDIERLQQRDPITAD